MKAMTLRVAMGVMSLVFFGVTAANANMVLTNEYTVSVATTQLGLNQYRFEYTVTNNTEGIPGTTTGQLCDIVIQLPSSATLSNITPPSPYTNGYWGVNFLTSTDMEFWGNGPSADYPVGSQLQFAFTASNVSVGHTTAHFMTYWAGHVPNHEYVQAPNGLYYSTFDAAITGPAAPDPLPTVPLPSAAWAGMGLLGTMGIIRYSRRKHPIT